MLPLNILQPIVVIIQSYRGAGLVVCISIVALTIYFHKADTATICCELGETDWTLFKN